MEPIKILSRKPHRTRDPEAVTALEIAGFSRDGWEKFLKRTDKQKAQAHSYRARTGPNCCNGNCSKKGNKSYGHN